MLLHANPASTHDLFDSAPLQPTGLFYTSWGLGIESAAAAVLWDATRIMDLSNPNNMLAVSVNDTDDQFGSHYIRAEWKWGVDGRGCLCAR